jgi:hypothetical protein
MNIYSRVYGLDKAFFLNSIFLTFAATIHVFDVSNPILGDPVDPLLVYKEKKTQKFLAEAIQGLHEMKANRFLKVIRSLLEQWCAIVLDIIETALIQTLGESTTDTSDKLDLRIHNWLEKVFKVDC